jgi:hypothetical protein
MFKANKKHLQPLLISHINDLPEKHRQRLEQSWAGVFYRQFFCRIKEEPFAVLYADQPSRPNIPVNVLIGLETIKAGFGWSDEELYDHFLFDIQVRYAVGYRDLKEGSFELRTMYNFRRRLSAYNQEHGVNLITQAFEAITDQQLAALELKTNTQRMDSTQIASNMMVMSRLQLLVEGVQRMWRVLDETEQGTYQEWLEEYIQRDSGQYVYRVKDKETAVKKTAQIGKVIHRLLTETGPTHEKEPAYQVLERLFREHFNLTEAGIQTKPNDQIGSGGLQSVDDLEATYRRKGSKVYKGYVANLTQTCDEENPVQLITKVQVAPNNVEDTNLLAEAIPDLKERTGIDTIHVDGAYGSMATDETMNEHQVEMIQSAIRGNAPRGDKLSLSQFEFTTTENGKPVTMTCPNDQTVKVEPGRKTGHVARFDLEVCENCPLHNQCRGNPSKRDQSFNLHFSQREVNSARRRRRSEINRQSGKNPRAAIEATVRSVKHPFRAGKLPVRGLFRVTCMIIASAAMSNIRAIQRFQERKSGNEPSSTPVDFSLSLLFSSFLRCFSVRESCFSF